MEIENTRAFETLKEELPELADSFQRSYLKAVKEWLPAIPPKGISFNSYPHIRNLYANLELVINRFSKEDGQCLNLTGLEIYIILAAILFHDIGKMGHLKKDKEEHGTKSRREISGKYDYLGIPNKILADSIEKICEYHAPWAPREEGIKSELYYRDIYPYGYVREPEIARLLVLVDDMDGSFQRLIHLSLIGENQSLDTVSAFRSFIQGIDMDAENGYLYYSLTPQINKKANPEGKYLFSLCSMEDPPSEKEGKGFHRNTKSTFRKYFEGAIKKRKGLELSDASFEKISPFIFFDDDTKEIEKVIIEIKQAIGKGLQDLSDDSQKREITEYMEGFLPRYKEKLNEEYKKKTDRFNKTMEFIGKKIERPKNYNLINSKVPRKSVLLDTLFPRADARYFTLGDIMVISGLLWPASGNGNPTGITETSIVAAILKDLKTNKEKLKKNAPYLRHLNINLKDWLIKCNDHLFDHLGRQTVEPTVNRNLLMETTHAVWNLSGGIFSKKEIPYSLVQNSIGENDYGKVVTAVKRLSFITKELEVCNSENKRINAIIAENETCRWNCLSKQENSHESNDNKCRFVHIKVVEKAILNLFKELDRGENP